VNTGSNRAMNRNQAQGIIKASIKDGTDVNTSRSTYRGVIAVDSIINSSRYWYPNSQCGFTVQIGQSSNIKIPWSMLEQCFAALSSPGGYDGTFFRKRFSLQADDHPCYVHVVGQIFVKAGIARAECNKYI